MARHDEIWIPFGDDTALPGFRGYWPLYVDTARRRVVKHLNHATGHSHRGVRVVKVRLVPIDAARAEEGGEKAETPTTESRNRPDAR